MRMLLVVGLLVLALAGGVAADASLLAQPAHADCGGANC